MKNKNKETNNSNKPYWYPKFKDIMKIYKNLQDVYEDMEGHVLRNEMGLKGILDKVEYGLPFRETSFIEKVAYLWRDISTEHLFSEGNKRTGWLATRLILRKNGYSIRETEETTPEMIYDFCIKITMEKVDIDRIIE